MSAREYERIARVSRFWAAIYGIGTWAYFLSIVVCVFGIEIALGTILQTSRSRSEILPRIANSLIFFAACGLCGFALRALSRWQTRDRKTNHE